MDTLTHALSGALLARATYQERQEISLSARSWLGFGVAALPDIDFVLRAVDPLYYLNWHRGVTHSLVLMPLWAWLLAALVNRVSRRRWPIGALLRLFLLAIGIHIAGDLITSYGTRIFMPLWDRRFAIPTTFIIDPWFSAIIIGGLLASLRYRRAGVARAGLAVLATYVAMQGALHWQARNIARDAVAARELSPASAYVFPQPFSPFNWKLVIQTDDHYLTSYLRLYGKAGSGGDSLWSRLASVYRPPAQLVWRSHRRPDVLHESAPVVSAWRSRAMAAYRDFARFPALYRVDRQGHGTCVWFMDLRFAIHGLPPPFRYGACRKSEDEDWRLDRL